MIEEISFSFCPPFTMTTPQYYMWLPTYDALALGIHYKPPKSKNWTCRINILSTREGLIFEATYYDDRLFPYPKLIIAYVPRNQFVIMTQPRMHWICDRDRINRRVLKVCKMLAPLYIDRVRKQGGIDYHAGSII